MPETPREGAPIWIDYTCHNTEAMKTFYTEIFGWEFVDQGEDFGHYHFIRKDGTDVGGFAAAMHEDGTPASTEEMPTSWMIYLETLDIEKTVSAAEAAGAPAFFPPMAVGELGTFTVITDPAGAAVGLWQRGTYPGFSLPLTPGTPVWFENMSADFDAALPFYRDVLAWDVAWMGPDGEGDPAADSSGAEPAEGEMRYVTHGAGDTAVAGLCDAKEWFEQSQWRVYLTTENADEACAKVTELGGRIVDGPMDSPFGRVASAVDPEGGTFQIHQPLG